MPVLTRRQRAISWQRLPPEIRLIILEVVAGPDRERDMVTTQARNRNQAAYASVCREWQDYFEPIHFNALTLYQSDVAEFGRIMQGRWRAMLHWIWLHVELPEYGCDRCKFAESAGEIRAHNIIFTNAMTLELSVHSPSDAEHFCKDLRSRLHDKALGRTRLNRIKFHRDLPHGWFKGPTVFRPSEGAKERLFGPTCGLKFNLSALSARKMEPGLPKNSLVHQLMIRRQFCRAFSVHSALMPIIDALTHLEIFSYEPLRGLDKRDQLARRIRDNEHYHLLVAKLRYKASLKIVSMFEDSDPVLHNHIETRRSPYLGQALAQSSL
ncbi:Uu.00g117230.m01.CDS01 [Anthostomella pinea]|uniref:Uu.00g117230.m01.CDS01 n=1 Tax=Anthostomella pinea TaxID=933095 RepID=A0AAI8VH83_9PEZI|nr:Uu.00g117230.m01.CDS01 [Anthostomella pinea]